MDIKLNYNIYTEAFMKTLLLIGGIVTAVLIEYTFIYVVSLRFDNFPYTAMALALLLMGLMWQAIKMKERIL